MILEQIDNLIQTKYENYKKKFTEVLNSLPNYVQYQLEDGTPITSLKTNIKNNKHFAIANAGLIGLIVIKDDHFFLFKNNQYIHLGNNPNEFHSKLSKVVI